MKPREARRAVRRDVARRKSTQPRKEAPMPKHVTVLTTFEVPDEVGQSEIEAIVGAMTVQAIDATDAEGFNAVPTSNVVSIDAQCADPCALELLLKVAEVGLDGLGEDDCGYPEATIQAAWELLRDLTREV